MQPFSVWFQSREEHHVSHLYCQRKNSDHKRTVIQRDISKAFDKVWTQGLQYKLLQLGMPNLKTTVQFPPSKLSVLNSQLSNITTLPSAKWGSAGQRVITDTIHHLHGRHGRT